MNSLFLIIDTIEHLFIIVLLGMVSADFLATLIQCRQGKGAHTRDGKKRDNFYLLSAVAVLTVWIIGEFFAPEGILFHVLVHFPAIVLASLLFWAVMRRVVALRTLLYVVIALLFANLGLEVITTYFDTEGVVGLQRGVELLAVLALYFLVLRFLIITDHEHHS